MGYGQTVTITTPDALGNAVPVGLGNPLPTVAGANTPATASYAKGASIQQTGSLGSLNATALGAFDALDFQSVNVQIIGAFVGTVTFQTSNDGSTWVSKNLTSSTNTSGSTTTSAGIWGGDIQARYFRVIMSAYTSGTPSIVAEFNAYSTAPGAINSVAVTGSVTSTPATGTEYALVTTAVAVTGVVKASAGSLFELTIFNSSAATIYVKLYNKATAPTLASDVPRTTIPVVAGAYFPATFAAIGKRFGAGIAIAVTGAAAPTDTTAVAAGIQVNGTYV